MMNAETLLDAIGEIGDENIIDAETAARPVRRGWVKWAAAAAACLCVVAGVFVWYRHWMQGDSMPGEIKSDETAAVPRWEDMTDAQRYQTLDFDGIRYMRGRTNAVYAVPGAALGTAELTGRDQYSNEQHTVTKTVYAIDGVSPGCAVTARFDGDLYAYVNPGYRPATLGQFIDDLNLTETLELGTAYYTRYGAEAVEHGTLDDFDTALVWDDLLCRTDAESVENYDSFPFGRKIFSVAVYIPALGYGNMGLWVTEDGYLGTNILETGKAFDIGTDAVQTFLDAVYGTEQRSATAH